MQDVNLRVIMLGKSAIRGIPIDCILSFILQINIHVVVGISN